MEIPFFSYTPKRDVYPLASFRVPSSDSYSFQTSDSTGETVGQSIRNRRSSLAEPAFWTPIKISSSSTRFHGESAPGFYKDSKLTIPDSHKASIQPPVPMATYLLEEENDLFKLHRSLPGFAEKHDSLGKITQINHTLFFPQMIIDLAQLWKVAL